jgi:hypothetical protein
MAAAPRIADYVPGGRTGLSIDQQHIVGNAISQGSGARDRSPTVTATVYHVAVSTPVAGVARNLGSYALEAPPNAVDDRQSRAWCGAHSDATTRRIGLRLQTPSHCVVPRARENARRAAVISSPDLCVFAVAAVGVLCAFGCLVDALPEHCLRRRSGANPLVVAFFEFSSYYVSAVRLHVYAADVLVRHGVDREGFR